MAKKIKCRGCTSIKDASQFYKSASHSSGFNSLCAECCRQRSNEWNNQQKTIKASGEELDAVERARRRAPLVLFSLKEQERLAMLAARKQGGN